MASKSHSCVFSSSLLMLLTNWINQQSSQILMVISTAFKLFRVHLASTGLGFSFRNASLNHCSEVLVHVVMTTSHSSCRFVTQRYDHVCMPKCNELLPCELTAHFLSHPKNSNRKCPAPSFLHGRSNHCTPEKSYWLFSRPLSGGFVRVSCLKRQYYSSFWYCCLTLSRLQRISEPAGAATPSPPMPDVLLEDSAVAWLLLFSHLAWWIALCGWMSLRDAPGLLCHCSSVCFV